MAKGTNSQQSRMMALRFGCFLVPLVPSSKRISSDGGCWGSLGDVLAYQGDVRMDIVLEDYRVVKGAGEKRKGMTELKRWVFEYSGQIQGVGLHNPPCFTNPAALSGSPPGFLSCNFKVCCTPQPTDVLQRTRLEACLVKKLRHPMKNFPA